MTGRSAVSTTWMRILVGLCSSRLARAIASVGLPMVKIPISIGTAGPSDCGAGILDCGSIFRLLTSSLCSGQIWIWGFDSGTHSKIHNPKFSDIKQDMQDVTVL